MTNQVDENSAENFGLISSQSMEKAKKNVSDILAKAIGYSDQKAVVIYDKQCYLAEALSRAYLSCLPQAKFIDFNVVTPDLIHAEFAKLCPSDLVVLIQSTNFRLDKFRIRVALFNRSIKVIEHPHLSRMQGDEQLYYLDALAYDSEYFRNVGRLLKSRLDQAHGAVIESGDAVLTYGADFEDAKMNIGDYREMKNVGGQFPIGEVFTESVDLEAVNGHLRIFAFGDTAFKVNKPKKPITLKVSQGRVVETIDSTHEFEEVLANIRKDEAGEVWLRELGFGMNRAFTRERIVSDIGTYERMCGVHLSLGAKHNVYKKQDPKFNPPSTKHHVDIFADTRAVLLDGQNIYQENSWRI